jgi:hypothetical protein
LTKQGSDEAALKCHVPVEEATKVVENSEKVVGNNALVVCEAGVGCELEGKLELTVVKTRIDSLRSRLGRIMQRLYDLESGNEPKKPLHIDFDVDLYQMEDY